MATQACLNNIKNEDPPVYCGDEHCGHIQGDINKYCKHAGLGGDVPVPQWTGTGKCFCCCSCMAWGTPIEVSQGNYKLVEFIQTGELVLATGGNLAGWEPCAVTGVGGIAPGVPLDFCYTASFTLADGTVRTLISTADHLYLVPGGKLQPVQDLRPGDVVMQADGQQAKLNFVAVGQFSGGVRNFAMGDFDPKKHPDDPYKGHLMNTFGIVTADLAVQMAFYQQEFSGELLHKKEEVLPHIGSALFFERYDTRAYEAFMSTPEQWPEGFKAIVPALINIPPSALSYFTLEQANDLRQTEPNQNLGNSKALANFKYLRNIFSGCHPDFYYVADWSNELPNAWYFNQGDQSYLVVSGGLLRLPTLKIPGLSMVISHLVAQAEGETCAGDADYWGAALYFREIWFNELFFDMFEKALNEIKATFALINPDHSHEDPNNICARPSLECRMQAITNGGGFTGVPDCAKPPPAFAVTGAEATSLTEVKVLFSAPVLVETAQDPAHYTILEAQVTNAAVEAQGTSILLTVKGLESRKPYTVVVVGVLSARGLRLSPGHHVAKFTTP
jgi:hypothetical protein